jgi:pleiotropic regulator 1
MAAVAPDVQLQRGLKRSLDWFYGDHTVPPRARFVLGSARDLHLKLKLAAEYDHIPAEVKNAQGVEGEAPTLLSGSTLPEVAPGPRASDLQITPIQEGAGAIVKVDKGPIIPKPVWHRPWKLTRVISGHSGWVRALDVDYDNEWFVTSGNDRLIKFWDLATGTLKLTLTGHSSNVRDLKVHPKYKYLFSAAEDNEVKCWDLEQNKVIRGYHGHLSGVYCVQIHPTLDIIASGGRDSAVRVWDMRTKKAIFVLGGHGGAVNCIQSQASEPQFISGSMDKTVRLWDLAAGKSSVVLTNHKKSIRSMAIHPSEYTFASCGQDHIKVWKCPKGNFERNIDGHGGILNCCDVREEDGSSILVAGADNGELHFWDWRSGHKFQTIEGRVQPGSLDAENGIFALKFDRSYSRLITCECDKTIKVYKEDEEATPETHPINWKPPKNVNRF